jgi:O-antigen/teichoic acid export membrane protein
LFPHLSSRLEGEPLADLRRTVWLAFKTNLALAILLGAPFILLGRPILSLWIGRGFAGQVWPVLSILSCAFALFALNVTAHYTLLAMGRARLVTVVNIVAGAAMFLLMLLLTPRFGMLGTACARLICGPITCILYYPLYQMIRGSSSNLVAPSALGALERI